MLWHEQRWPTIRDLDKELPVVIPLGSLEQHGHHLPLFVDTIQVDAVAKRAEAELGDEVLLLPPLWLGCSHHHLDFPGTVSLLPSLYSQVVKGVVRCVLTHGFRRIFLLNGHGGNQVPMAQAMVELIAEDDRADAAFLAAASWWNVGKQALAPERHGMRTPQLTHACEYETSMILALRPDLVALPEAREGKPVLDSEWARFETGGRVSVYKRFHRMTASGSMGSPTLATAEKGHSMLAAVTADVVRFLRAFATWPHPDKIGPT
jgi:creatinine amidohydrolase